MPKIDVEQAVRMYEDGFSAYAIAKEFGCHNSSVYKALRRAGVEVRSVAGAMTALRKVEASEVAAMYERGHTAKEVAEFLGCSTPLVYKKLRSLGVTRRSYKRPDVDDEEVVHMYVEEGWPLMHIASHYQCDHHTIRRRLIRNGVTLRSKEEIVAEHDYGKIPISRSELERLYIGKGLSFREIAVRLGCNYSTINRRIEEFGINARSSSPFSRRVRSKRFEVSIRVDSGWELRVYTILRRQIGDTFLFQGDDRPDNRSPTLPLAKPDSIRKEYMPKKSVYHWTPDFLLPEHNMVLEVKGLSPRVSRHWNGVVVPCIKANSIPYEVRVLYRDPTFVRTWGQLMDLTETIP